MKKDWNKPELTILVRGKKEESLLDICKTEVLNGSLTDFEKCMTAYGSTCSTSCESFTNS